jgi:endonuclease YncB( thermonuclease family)
MAWAAAIGCVLFAVLAVTDGNLDWHRYTSIVGFIVLACAGSWAVSALSAIAFQTSRRLLPGGTRGRRTGPWDRRAGDKVVRLPERGTGGAAGRVLPSLPMVAGAIAIGAIGSLFVFSQSGTGDAGSGVNVIRGGEVARSGSDAGEATSKTAVRKAGGGQYSLCSAIVQRSCVIDGDTIRHGWTKIRLADIDTPEISAPKCASEAALGHRAKERLLELMNEGRFEVVHPGGRDEDVYGRKLRVLMRNGRSLGMILVDEGLARRWTGSRRSWCV